MIEYLIRHGCDIDRYNCSSPVHLAAYLGDMSLLSLFIELGAKVLIPYLKTKRDIIYIQIFSLQFLLNLQLYILD